MKQFTFHYLIVRVISLYQLNYGPLIPSEIFKE